MAADSSVTIRYFGQKYVHLEVPSDTSLGLTSKYRGKGVNGRHNSVTSSDSRDIRSLYLMGRLVKRGKSDGR